MFPTLQLLFYQLHKIEGAHESFNVTTLSKNVRKKESQCVKFCSCSPQLPHIHFPSLYCLTASCCFTLPSASTFILTHSNIFKISRFTILLKANPSFLVTHLLHTYFLHFLVFLQSNNMSNKAFLQTQEKPPFRNPILNSQFPNTCHQPCYPISPLTCSIINVFLLTLLQFHFRFISKHQRNRLSSR